MTESDETLLELWRLGDRLAGARLFDRYFAALTRFFRNKSRDGIDDLIQTAFVGLLEGRDRFRGEGSFRSFVFGVAYNTLRQHYRQAAKTEDLIHVTATSFFDRAPEPEHQLGAHAEQRRLLQALRRIPMEHQVLLELYFWEPLSAGEIARALEVPEGTVRTRIRRAKTLLREQLTSLEVDPKLVETTMSGLEDWAQAIRATVRAEV